MPRKRKIPLIGARIKNKKGKSSFPGIHPHTGLPESPENTDLLVENCVLDCNVEAVNVWTDHDYGSKIKTVNSNIETVTPVVDKMENTSYDHTYALQSELVPCDVEIVTDNNEDKNCELLNLEEMDYSDDLKQNEQIFMDMNVAENITVKTESDSFTELYELLQSTSETPFLVTTTGKIKVVEMYDKTLKTCVLIDSKLNVEIFVHNRRVPNTHEIFDCLSKPCVQANEIMTLLKKLKTYYVCLGNPESEFVNLVPEGSALSERDGPIAAYREGDFGAEKGSFRYSATIRTTACDLLTSKDRCIPCSRYRAVLRCKQYRNKKDKEVNKTQRDYIHSNYKHQNMDRNQLILKINQQKNEIKCLTSEVEKLNRKLSKYIQQDGLKMDKLQSLELSDLMSSCENEVSSAFPDENCFQRLFWNQQLKESKSGKNGMRWHPMIIRWCLYLRQTSNKCYEALRDSGFLKLPSSRTLFDYSHYAKSGTGFSSDVLLMLKEEANKMGLYEESWKSWVGLLFDEVRVKEDLVYDKHTGELVGYVDLDSVGNNILELESHLKNRHHSLAKFMLVVMVRGLSSNLKFPLAGFATNSITADFLYPIIWKCILYIEMYVNLKVLCVTCDGASANRKFFKLHKEIDEVNETYYTINPHDENRKIYFISDVPHLLKTTRNCFSNSFWHKQSRQMWKNGKDISWRHIVRLYEEHCENSLYTPCPKITYGHINLTAFSIMKVNLAAQVLSSTVANSLEQFFGVEVTETVEFIRTFDKFFDCLNVRNLFEGRNKRNPNLNPYTEQNDERLLWLQRDFIGYLNDWKDCVNNRAGNFTPGQRNTMLLSHQTLSGLSLTVNSAVECVRTILGSGAPFVLTHCFNQDPLEQHFGHYRHKGGSNANPSVFEVRHTMTQLRTIGAQAIVPKRGNVTINGRRQNVIDNTKLPRRRPLRH